MNKSRSIAILFVILGWLATSAFQPLPPTENVASGLIAASSVAAPDAFGKVSPTNGSSGLPATGVVLQWNASSANVTYQYCLRTNGPTPSCPGPKWVNVGTVTQAPLQSLTPGVTYYWQVRTIDDATQAITYADAGAWWWFTVQSNTNLPGQFNKIAPVDASTGVAVSGLSLSWGASSRALSYEYCYDTLNNNICDQTWMNVGSATSVSVSGLAHDTLYYWQVRAVNAAGNVQADFGTWWSFRTRVAPPGDFSKLLPVNGASNRPLSLTLSWEASTRATSYEYCYDTNAGSTCAASSTWTSTGANTSVNLTGLNYETTYYWQVRAVNATDVTPANLGAYWSFSTPIAPPAAFGKSGPDNNLFNQPLNPTLSWSASAGTNVTYAYCISTTTTSGGACNGVWNLAGANTSVPLSGLAYDTLYYWQVRAVNTTSTTYADNGALWHFTTLMDVPSPFAKISPTGPDKVSLDVHLEWSASTGAVEYFYCVSNNQICDNSGNSTNWISTGNGTAAAPAFFLALGHKYYWQVKARNSQGDTLADGGAWWSFTTIDNLPGGFIKYSPASGATNQLLSPWLYWTPSGGAISYEYCINTVESCPLGGWTPVTPVGTNTFVNPSGLSYDTQYFWQVRAVNGPVEADGGVWSSFSTLKTPPVVSDLPFETNEDTPLVTALSVTSASYAPLTYTLVGSLPAGTLDFHSDGGFTYTPVPNFDGQVSFQFAVSDGYNPPSAPHTATITVKPVNDLPVLNLIPDQVVKTGTLVTFTAVATDADLPYGDTLTYSILEPLPAGASFDPATGQFSWISHWTLLHPGAYSFTVVVTDAALNSVQQVVHITVNPEVILLPLIFR